MDNSKIIFLFLNENNICSDLSLEWSVRWVLMRGPNICFYGEILKIIPKLSLLPFLSGAPNMG